MDEFYHFRLIVYKVMDDYLLNQYMRPAKVCLCKGVTENDIKNAVLSQNADSLLKVIQITKATTGCGTCIDKVNSVIQKYNKQKSYPLFAKEFK